MELFTTRPASPRTEVEEKVYDCLEKLAIPFEGVDHEPAETIEKCLEIDKVLGTEICKNLLLCNRQQTAFYLLLIPGQKVFKTKDLSAQINSARLSFASGELMEELLSTSPGSLSVLSLLFDRDKEVRLLIDSELMEQEHWGMHPCKNTTSLKIKKSDILEKFLPSVFHTPTVVTL